MIKCNTPSTMLVDICKTCKRVTTEKGRDIATYIPENKKFGWVCGEYLEVKGEEISNPVDILLDISERIAKEQGIKVDYCSFADAKKIGEENDN